MCDVIDFPKSKNVTADMKELDVFVCTNPVRGKPCDSFGFIVIMENDSDYIKGLICAKCHHYYDSEE